MKNNIQQKGFDSKSQYRGKITIQDFVTEINRDREVLVYRERHFLPERKTRKNNFKATGSGIFKYIREMPAIEEGYADGIDRFIREDKL